MDTGPERDARRRRIGLIERLEDRDLPTAPTLLAGATGTSVARTLRSLTAAADIAHQPTPHERAREAFVAKFAGSSVTGPGRFTDQASQTLIKGGGTSSAFLHGNLQMAAYAPTDPAG